MEPLAIEPLLPGLSNRVLTDMATKLWVESSALNSNLQVATIWGVGDRANEYNQIQSTSYFNVLSLMSSDSH
jgi:hypothetical protein